MYNGTWMMRFALTSISYNTLYYYNETAMVNSFAMNGGSYNSIATYMDDYGTIFRFDYNVSLVGLVNVIPAPNIPERWRNYGWNSVTSQWELNNPNGKPVHTSSDDLVDGLKCSFTPTGTNDFIAGERWHGYLTDGLHKDNSTSATVGFATHARSNYITTDLSSNIIPSSFGATLENFNVYTLTTSALAWNGMLNGNSALYNSSTAANSLYSEIILNGDFTFEFKANPYSGSASDPNTVCYVGLYNTTGASALGWTFRLGYNGYAVYEINAAMTTLVVPTNVHTYSISRTGNTITYMVDGVVVYTSLVTSTSPLRGIFRMPSNDSSRSIFDMKVSYNEIRPVVKIGNASNQTGVYDQNYAMVEAWLNNPQTIKVSIDGNPATVITDPSIVPVAGQALLLQKSGMLVFNTADIGKSITCNAMILTEL
jgi:hypothetical protein